jgi:hypothetical protein
VRRRLAVLLAVVALAAGACGDDGDGDGDQELFCARLDRLARNDPFRAVGDTASSAEVEEAFQALLARADELVDVAPPELRPAARDYAEAADALESLLSDVGYDPFEVDARAYQAQQVAYFEAAQRLERYLDTGC